MNVRLVDCRPREAYDDGHVPGAVHLDPETTLSSPTDDPSVGGRHPLPDPHALGAAFAAAGIGPETFVLALDEGTGWAARCWWLLRHLGHDLCGTFDQRFYVGPLTTDEPRVERAAFVPHVRDDDTIEAEEIRMAGRASHREDGLQRGRLGDRGGGGARVRVGVGRGRAASTGPPR